MKTFPKLPPRTQHLVAFAAAALLASTGCLAQQATAASPSVTVSTLRDPVDKSYRKIVRGMDLFEKHHAMAPGATLRFKLLPRLEDTKMDGITLKIVGDSMSLPVPVAADRSFALERNATLLKEDASVMPNRKADSMTWRADIRSPGVPAGMRRLGDLRLECRVGVEAGLISQGIPVIGAVARAITTTLTDPCASASVNYFFFAERALFNVTLVHGARRESLPASRLYSGATKRPVTKSNLKYFDAQVLLDHTYFAPLGDLSWPDDTLLEFDYMTDAPVAAQGEPA
jgi:hypothetical protein